MDTDHPTMAAGTTPATIIITMAKAEDSVVAMAGTWREVWLLVPLLAVLPWEVH